MAQANFHYEPANDRAGLPLGLSIFADRPHVRAEMRDDAEAAGFRLSACGDVAALLTGDDVHVLGEVVLLDCPALDCESMAALCRLDMRVAFRRASGRFDQRCRAGRCVRLSRPVQSADPGRSHPGGPGDRAGARTARIPNLRVRELSEEDRLMLLRLVDQPGLLADLEALRPPERERRSPGLRQGTPRRPPTRPSPPRDRHAPRRRGSSRPDRPGCRPRERHVRGPFAPRCFAHSCASNPRRGVAAPPGNTTAPTYGAWNTRNRCRRSSP